MPGKELKNKTLLQKVMYGVAIVGTLSSIGIGPSLIKEYLHKEAVEANKEENIIRDKKIIDLGSTIDNHIKENNKSKSIGLRVHINGQLYYRAEDLKEYPAYKDIQMSEDYNYPYYYYINPLDGEKEWCK